MGWDWEASPSDNCLAWATGVYGHASQVLSPVTLDDDHRLVLVTVGSQLSALFALNGLPSWSQIADSGAFIGELQKGLGTRMQCNGIGLAWALLDEQGRS
jgi:hypothetical protein